MFGKFYKFSIRNNQINLLYSVYSNWIKFCVSIWRFVPPKRVTLRNTLFGLNFPHPSLLVVRSVRVERRDLLMDHRNLNKCKTLRKSDKTNLSLTNRLSLDREYRMQCSAPPSSPPPPPPPPPPHQSHHSLLLIFKV